MKYSSVGKCIYCGSRTDLSDEHIIPEGLHGDWVLPKASCGTCRQTTGLFEQRVLRGPLWPARTELRLKTKRPKERPTSFPMSVVRDGVSRTESVPVGKNLPCVILPLLGKPGILVPSAPRDCIALEGWYVGHINRTPNQVQQGLSAEAVSLSVKYPVADFVRMLAKIGYAFAVARLGLENVVHPLVLPGILGGGTDLGQWVGAVSDAKAFPDPSALHGASIQREGDFVAVALQLFTLQPTPIYLVLVSRGRRM